MPEGTLYIGNKRYSSWSLRGWLSVRLANLDVDIRVIPFERPGPTKSIAALSPNGLVPFLDHNGAHVWESLSVCDYCAEFQPALWPTDRIARAHARSISAEMHAGFRDLRTAKTERRRALCRTSPASRHCGRKPAHDSAREDRSCSAQHSAPQTRCSRPSSLGF
jgi:glutathione S-transferase